MGDNILEIKNLSKNFKDFSLNNLNLIIPRGVIMGLIGENGAGKSTTINCILNEIGKSTGEIYIFGKDHIVAETKIKDKIGVVFDENHFPDIFTPKEVGKCMSGIFSNWEWSTYNNYLKQFELPENKNIKDFSKGMKVKLAFSVALSHRAEFLILDEATGGLDPIVRDEMLDTFLDFVQEENHSILLSSHITSDLEKVADYITFIHNGKLIMTVSKNDLVYNYAVMRCKENQFLALDPTDIIAYRKRDFQIDVLVSDCKAMQRKYKEIVIDHVSVDEIFLLLVRGDHV